MADGLGHQHARGMPALDPEGTFVPGTFEEEADLAWHNVTTIAEAAGYSIGDAGGGGAVMRMSHEGHATIGSLAPA